MEKDINELKNKTISGLFWRFGERITAQLISFIVSVVLARILMPEEYGIIAIVIIFINLANTFVTNGLGTALVQKKDSDELDFSTIFHASVILSILLYGIIFFTAPLIAYIYHNKLLTAVLRIMGLRIPIAAINSIQQAYVQRKMIFKKFFFATLIGTIVSAFVGIIAAVKGAGVWALVYQYLTNCMIDTIILGLSIAWRPKLLFSYERFKSLFRYGSRIMLTGFIGTLFDQLRGLLIGVKYTSSDLAYNNRGEQVPLLLTNNITSTLESVLFSTISKVQEDAQKVKNAIRRLMKMSSFLLFPILFGLAGIAESFVKIIYTEKWLPAVPFLRIICIQQCFSILNTVNLQAIKAVGRSDVLLKLEFIKKPIYISLIAITIFISPIAICIGITIYGFIALFINAKPNRRLLNYSLKEQFSDILIYFIISIIMMITVILVGHLKINIYMLLLLQIFVGAAVYIGLCFCFRVDSMKYTINILKDFLRKGTKEANE